MTPRPARDADVVVIGAGVMGAATARSLSRSGREVLLLEQFDVGHTRGSSHGTSRIFRLSYNHEIYVRMAQAALPLWRDLERETGDNLLTKTGGVDIGTALGAHMAALSSCGVPFELLDGTDANSRLPSLRLGQDERALYQPDAGIVAADRAVRAFVASAVSHGAELREGTRVVNLAPDDSGASVETSAGTYKARVVVVTAGSWGRGLLATTGIDLATVATRETVAYFRADDEPSLPTVVDWRSPVLYALASAGRGMKAGEHHGGPVTDPEDPGHVDEASVSRLAAWVGRRFRGVEVVAAAAETCLYTNTADEHFVLSRKGPIVVGSPCSGHGFKFAPLIGERLARLASDGPHEG